MPLTFTVEDMKTPEKLERVFQQVRLAMSPPGEAQGPTIDLTKLAAQLAPLIKPQLQATGAAPIDTTILLPTVTLSVLPGGGALTINTGAGLSGGGLVALGGILTLINAGVTSIVAGTGITISGATGAVTINSTGGAFPTFTIEAAPFNAASNTAYWITGNGVTVTLPGSPADGDWVCVVDGATVTTCVIARNGKTIMGLSSDMTIDTVHFQIVLIYRSATGDWRLAI